MRIIRNGKIIKLTPEELRRAYNVYKEKKEMDEVTEAIQDILDENSDYDLLRFYGMERKNLFLIQKDREAKKAICDTVKKCVEEDDGIQESKDNHFYDVLEYHYNATYGRTCLLKEAK